jgi:hypothetical protein
MSTLRLLDYYISTWWIVKIMKPLLLTLIRHLITFYLLSLNILVSNLIWNTRIPYLQFVLIYHNLYRERVHKYNIDI